MLIFVWVPAGEVREGAAQGERQGEQPGQQCHLRAVQDEAPC